MRPTANPIGKLFKCWRPGIMVALTILLLFLPNAPVSSSTSFPSIRSPEANPFPPLPASPGCFTSEPYTGVWKAVPCAYGRVRPTVGGSSNDLMLSDSKSTSEGNGSISFPTYAGETNTAGSSVCSDSYVGLSETYSLQQNTNQFTGSNGDNDWTQFTSQVNQGLKPVVGVLEIDVTTKNFNDNQTTTAPWYAPLNTTITYYLNGGIVRSYYGTVFVETELYYVNYPSSGSDTVSSAVVVSESDTLGLSGNWNKGEMNIFGIGCGNQATFKTGSSAYPYLSFPVCNGNSFYGTTTAESNNFNIGSSTTVGCTTSNTTYVYFSESH